MAIMMLNGKPISEEEATISVLDHGLLYGVGAFETFRIYQGHLFLIEDHLTRLEKFLQRMMITLPYTRREWEEQIHELLQLNGMTEGIVRLSVTGGIEGLGLTASSYKRPSTMIFVRPLPFEPKQLFETGKKLQVVSVPRHAGGGLAPYKSNNYLNLILARQEVSDFPHTEGLMITENGYLAEGIVSNLFFVRREKICTPGLDLGILPGITRQWILHLAKSLGYKIEEGHYTLADLDQADEIFVTNSVQEIVPIYTWNGQRKQPRQSIVQQLYQEYQKYTTKLRSINECLEGSMNDEQK
ncbi:aminotransferase class IV [Thermoflavimicrobium dichotomicum]|uniref:4-amino-4-deoxychorismate lyase n=1 Tax=Thermoflavimicrobium dichotomicum TaxID=46223 RepID=A0A1I3QSH4_9BACL|nr:aminotransferase class IV [Thermoflavimicrobium dichotomicum]SFJ36066.1 4-amino-4-deoxychorismate lyase [Thermoflavimicrobium dichotomicum]